MRGLIVSGGSIDEAFALNYIEAYKPEYVIAADKGMEFCKRAGLIPDCIVGDFDSADREVVKYFHQLPQILWKHFQPEKDETDTELAVTTAMEHRVTELHILGATGTRLDHVLGNIQLLQKAMMREIPAYIVDTSNRITLVDTVREIKKAEQFGDYVSILPLTTEVRNITLTGFKYPLEHGTLYSDNSLGISNEIVAETARIELEEGVAIVIESRDS